MKILKSKLASGLNCNTYKEMGGSSTSSTSSTSVNNGVSGVCNVCG